MCNLYSSTTAVEAMRQLFEVSVENDHLGNAEPRTAIWPKYRAPVVRLNEDGERELVEMNWGFLTKKVSKKTGKDLKPQPWNNARDDAVMKNGLWKNSFLNRRCLVPASSFREAKGKNPAEDFWFALKDDVPRPPFAMAGLWQPTPPGLAATLDDNTGFSHTVVTTTANEIVQPVHPTRMVVILDPADYETWLQGSPDEAKALLRPYPPERMQIVQQGYRVLQDDPTSEAL
ncbi:SOS response-associated peptidase [uncultured Roseobacter sp.]|uniref:SOS response-associated peptidase n=1 Tax=uncultured Roseobacter sp. TaxID=114847 RepID=UPI00261981C8|nr:SOS response-associated peptidase [uncultured Roseobacter sp.]